MNSSVFSSLAFSNSRQLLKLGHEFYLNETYFLFFSFAPQSLKIDSDENSKIQANCVYSDRCVCCCVVVNFSVQTSHSFRNLYFHFQSRKSYFVYYYLKNIYIHCNCAHIESKKRPRIAHNELNKFSFTAKRHT